MNNDFPVNKNSDELEFNYEFSNWTWRFKATSKHIWEFHYDHEIQTSERNHRCGLQWKGPGFSGVYNWFITIIFFLFACSKKPNGKRGPTQLDLNQSEYLYVPLRWKIAELCLPLMVCNLLTRLEACKRHGIHHVIIIAPVHVKYTTVVAFGILDTEPS